MGNPASESVNISSLVVGVLPEHVAEVKGRLQSLEGVEIHATAEDGRMIVTIEAPSDETTVQRFDAVRQTPGVLSASLVYHRYETDPDEEA